MTQRLTRAPNGRNGSFLAHGLQGDDGGKLGSRSMWQLHTWHPQPRSKDMDSDAQLSFSFIVSPGPLSVGW